jgi:hypothetical protein
MAWNSVKAQGQLYLHLCVGGRKVTTMNERGSRARKGHKEGDRKPRKKERNIKERIKRKRRYTENEERKSESHVTVVMNR